MKINRLKAYDSNSQELTAYCTVLRSDIDAVVAENKRLIESRESAIKMLKTIAEMLDYKMKA